MAAKRMKDHIPAGATVALIFPDRGERYLDTIFSDQWVFERFGRFASIEDSEVSNESMRIPVMVREPSPVVMPKPESQSLP